MTEKCKCCGAVDEDAKMNDAIAKRDANGGSNSPTRLWRVGRKTIDGSMAMHAKTDGKGWYFYAHTTIEAAQNTCDQYNQNLTGHAPEMRYVPVEITLPSQSAIPHHAICTFKDGDQWCAVFGDFVNLQESLAGFGPSFMEAIDDLQSKVNAEVARAQEPSTPAVA